MARRSDVRTRMITAARRLYRQHGYAATAFSDVLEAAEAPRGSVYHHFPGGKEELGIEVVLLHTADTLATINRAALTATGPADIIATFINASRDRFAASDYREGCAVAPIIIEATPASPRLTEVISRGMNDVVTTLASRMTEKGVLPEDAKSLATAAVSATEGALVVARSLRDTSPFDTLRELLVARASAVGSSATAGR